MMTREAAIQHRLYQSAMQGNVHAQIFLARRFEKYGEQMLEINAKFVELVSRLKEEKREATLEEMAFINGARVAMGDVPRPNAPAERVRKRRSRRKPKRKNGGSDPGVKS